jgi:hypothetical protein
MSEEHQAGALRSLALPGTLTQSDPRVHAMHDNRHRLTLRIFRIIEGEAEGPLAILAFFVLALAAIAMTMWFQS